VDGRVFLKDDALSHEQYGSALLMTDKWNVGRFRQGTLPFQLILIGNLKIG